MGEDITQEFPQNSLGIILARLQSMETSHNARMDSFESRLTSLDEKVDRRLLETRPIWERVLSRLDSIDIRLDSLESRLDSLENRVRSVESQLALLVRRFDRVEEDFEDMGLKFRTFQNDLLRMQTRQEKLSDRIEKIENPPAT
jgi:chromosome segregation ATPase